MTPDERPGFLAANRDRLVVIALSLYVAVLALGTVGAVFDVKWILRLF